MALCEQSIAIFWTDSRRREIAQTLRLGETAYKRIGTECVEGLALIASAQGNDERAKRLLEATQAAREALGHATPAAGAVHELSKLYRRLGVGDRL